jgi:ornithine cyclodeaminase/alanine dehydrogenase-like protein (mu-crystallin family)
MRVLAAEEIQKLITPRSLVEVLRHAFQAGLVCPPRQIVAVPGGAQQRLCLLMPAFDRSGAGAVKLVTVFPGNAARALPTIQAAIVLFSEDGTPVAMLDGTIVTRLRTAAASALASTFLSRHDSAHLVIIGTGSLAPHMAAAHAAVRPIRRISICGRREAAAERTAADIRLMVKPEVEVLSASSVETAVVSADIVSCVTSSATPVLAGRWLREGTFVDLVGGFSPDKREADDDVMKRSRIFVDTFAGAMAEAGDILDPLSRGVIAREQVEAELADLASGRHVGRITDSELVTFKSVGTAIEDLAAAQAVLAAACGNDRCSGDPSG